MFISFCNKTKEMSVILEKEHKKKVRVFSACAKQFTYLKTRHSWHLVDPSPWPFVSAMGAFFLTSGTVLYMHKYIGGGNLAMVGFVSILFIMFVWWRDVVREGTFEGQHTHQVELGLRMGMILFIVSELMFFFAFFWAFFYSSVNPAPEIGAIWPPKGIECFSPWEVPFLNTLIL